MLCKWSSLSLLENLKPQLNRFYFYKQGAVTFLFVFGSFLRNSFEIVLKTQLKKSIG